MNDHGAQTHQFEAEVNQLLNLMVNNLYQHKEVFLRELVSNASDALDQLRFAALENEDLYEGEGDLEIRIDWDEADRTVTVWDNGIGMSRREVVDNLGTIARSGAREFMEKMQEGGESDAELIGQFGVGFYSAFIVADRVVVRSRRAGLDPEEGVRWESTGEGAYEIENIEREQRGTAVKLHLDEGEDAFLDARRLREIVETYSDHVSFPIRMPAEEEDEEGLETVNRASALWTRRESEIDEEEYEEFYKHVAADFNEPLTHTHSHVEGRMKFTFLLYIPEQQPLDMAPGVEGDNSQGIKLYVRRVFIMDDAEMFLPTYLRFVRGVVDSDDLSLNVSRESLQENRVVEAMKQTVTNRVLEMIEDLTESETEYQTFWQEFGGILKEGVVEDRANSERIARLLRFASTHRDRPEQTVSLEDYVERMNDDQEEIYYITAESFAGAENSPHLEVFRDNDVEVLLMYDRIDEWVVNHLEEYDDYELTSVAVGELDAEEVGAGGEGDDGTDEEADRVAPLISELQTRLSERVQLVRMTDRLKDSPACLVAQEGGMSKNFERILRQAGQQVPDQKPVLEINPGHPIVERLNERVEEGEEIGEWADILFDQAWLSEGGRLDDPAGFVRRMNDKMIELLGEPSSDIITEV